MKVLVTGGNGCVGSALKLECPDWIFIGRNDCNLLNREKTIETFQMLKPDCVIHLAAYVPGFYNIDRVSSFSNNVRINENVLEATHLAAVQKAMFCLSVNMFTEKPSKFPMDESMIFEGSLTGPFAGYSYSKRMLELQVQNYNVQYGRKYFSIIPCNIYGPNDNFSSGRLISNLINLFRKAINENSEIMISGTGEPLRQFIYATDLAKIIKYLISNYSDTSPVICCSDEEINIKCLVNHIAEITKFNSRINYDPSKPDGNLKKTMDNSYLKKVMPSISFTSLKAGLEQIIGAT